MRTFILALLLAVAFVGGRPDPAAAQAGGSLTQRLQDSALATKIKLALVEAEDLRVFNFEPQARAGQVILYGSVYTPAQRERAAEVARGVDGVREIVNQVAVAGQPPPAAQPAPPPVRTPATRPPPTAAKQSPRAAEKAPPKEEPAKKAEPARKKSQPVYHRVRRGDNLGAIARRYGTSVTQLKRLNGLRSNNIQVGQRLKVKE